MWHRLENETDAAFSAFKIYLALEPRSISKVAKKLSKSLSLIKRWSAKYDWRNRAIAYDNSILEETHAQEINRRKKDIERQHEIGDLLIEKAVAILQTADTKRGTFYAAAQMADLGCKLINESYDLGNVNNKDSDVTITIRRAERVTGA